MCRSIFRLAILCCLVALLAWACDDSSTSTGVAGVGMDLIATEDPAPLGKAGGFCGDDSSELIVSVANQGSEDILVETVTAVIFENDAGIWDFLSISKQKLPAIAAGQTIVQYFVIPAACYDPVCDFKIVLDYDDILNESSKANNTVEGVCYGNSDLIADEVGFGMEPPERPDDAGDTSSPMF